MFMEQILIDLQLKIFGGTWITCFTGAIISDYTTFVDATGKLIMLILGVIGGILMVKVALLKRKQADVDLEISRMKLEEEYIQKTKRKEHETEQ